MPLFEFDCSQCKSLTDEIRLIADRDKPYNCPYCGAVCIRRTWSATAIIRWKEQCSDGKSILTSMGPTEGLHPAGRDQRRLRSKEKPHRPSMYKDQWEGPQTNFNSQGYTGQMPPDMPAPNTLTKTKKLDGFE